MNTPIFKTLLLVPTLLVSLAFPAHGSISSIQGFELKTCNVKKKCIQLISEKAESGNITPIMTIRNFKLEIKEQGHVRNLTGSFGYYDSQEAKLVLTVADGKDLEINLKDLSEKKY